MDKDNSVKSNNSDRPKQEPKELNLEDYEIIEVNDHPDGNLPACNRVAIIVGQWAMPTTVVLVLITCFSGFYLSEAAFTPVVGMIAPVVMALIMVIRDASVGKEEDPTVKDRENERKERSQQYQHEKDVTLAKMGLDERIKKQEISEHARQFDMMQASTKEFFELIKEMNARMTQQMTKPKSTELAVGETKVVISDGSSKVQTRAGANAVTTEE
ncbi:hypothetical protein SG34_023980 [Thalassomonas viridans]|uniref:Uncharacterized protein n=1 Tax=Thalassomonas viridans TaxID=137584 RepID=A0AAF0C8H3_9GAMM|nr:hypothetical protein [Thalassomonas viridans]WDE04366.1 hypothetical protein SG34_023980 [Thalassomonas viridans]